MIGRNQMMITMIDVSFQPIPCITRQNQCYTYRTTFHPCKHCGRFDYCIWYVCCNWHSTPNGMYLSLAHNIFTIPLSHTYIYIDWCWRCTCCDDNNSQCCGARNSPQPESMVTDTGDIEYCSVIINVSVPVYIPYLQLSCTTKQKWYLTEIHQGDAICGTNVPRKSTWTIVQS